MTISEMATLLDKDERTCRVALQQEGNPFGYACKEEDGQRYKYFVNATAVLEFAGQCGNKRQLVKEMLDDYELYAKWGEVLYPEV